MNEAIGGYFHLELTQNKEYYTNFLRLNTARNALEYIIKARNYKKLLLPKYSCDSIIQPLKKNKIKFDFYTINEKLTPELTNSTIDEETCLLVINYFGLLDEKISQITTLFRNIIIDNSQAFFSHPFENIDTFYSVRKFFGVPDGAYLFTNVFLEEKIGKSISWNFFDFLTKRIDLSPEEGYSDFLKNEERLNDQPIKIMSDLTLQILRSIDYDAVKKKRIENFWFLHMKLKDINELSFLIEESNFNTPMIYPLLINKKGLRESLISNHIYIAQYWQEVLKRTNSHDWERYLSKNLIPLPIDHRYSINDMKRILKILKLV